jgi:hypothetical protein
LVRWLSENNSLTSARQGKVNQYQNNVTETIKSALNGAGSKPSDVTITKVEFSRIITNLGQYTLIIHYKKDQETGTINIPITLEVADLPEIKEGRANIIIQ